MTKNGVADVRPSSCYHSTLYCMYGIIKLDGKCMKK